MDDNVSGHDASDIAIPAPRLPLPDTDTITSVLKTRDWLDGQSYDLAVALKAEKLDLLETQDVVELQERISSQQAVLYKISADQALQELVQKKVQYNNMLSDTLFSEPLPSTADADSDTGQGDEERRKYETLLKEHCKLSSAILRKQENVVESQKELDTIRTRNFELKKRNRGLMGVMGEHGKRLEQMADQVKNNSACRGLKEELEGTVSRVQIAKSTLQVLIVGSGVDWAADPDLLDTVLLCGDTMQL